MTRLLGPCSRLNVFILFTPKGRFQLIEFLLNCSRLEVENENASSFSVLVDQTYSTLDNLSEHESKAAGTDMQLAYSHTPAVQIRVK